MISDYQKNIILDILMPHKPLMIGLFGSYARGEQQADSDLDLLVQFKEKINLLEIIGLEQSLADKLGVHVDLITDRSVHPKILAYINRDLLRIF